MLRSENEAKVLHLANVVDKQMSEFRTKLREQSAATLSVLSALNIAEREYEAKQQQEEDLNFISTELHKMSDYLNACYND